MKSLAALALGTFALGISEFLMMGILGNVSESLNVSISEAGHLISAYAAGVCVGAPALLFFRKSPLKKIMMVLAGIIAAGNMFAFLSPNFWMLASARFISGLPHGAYFGVGAIVARRLVRPGHEVGAVSFMIGGMTVATLIGVPFGTFVTNTLSWHYAFLIVALFGIATCLSIRYLVPDVGKLKDMGFKGQFHFLRRLPPWLIFGGVIFGQTGFYCWYSYIDPELTMVAGFSPDALSWLMILAGFGMFAGNAVIGLLGSRFKPSSLAGTVELIGIPVMILFYLFASNQIAATILMVLGTAILFGSGSPLQSSIVGYSKGGEMLGAASIQIAYNLGNAIAAYIGGAAISSGWGYASPAIVGLPLIAVGVILLFWLYFKYERDSLNL